MQIIKKTLTNAVDREFTMNIYVRDVVDTRETTENLPIAVIFAGGSFMYLSPREMEPIIFSFMARGMQAAVVHYNLVPDGGNLYPDAALSGLEAVKHLRQNADEYHVDPNNIVTIGFSAGGSVVSTMNGMINDETVLNQTDLQLKDIRPNASILGYPLIDIATIDFDLSGDQQLAIPQDENLRSSAKMVGEQTPPTFIFHTVTDQTVPVVNSLEYAEALNENHIPYELHLFGQGPHGLSLATTSTVRVDDADTKVNPHVAKWFDLAWEWLGQNLHHYIFETK